MWLWTGWFSSAAAGPRGDQGVRIQPRGGSHDKHRELSRAAYSSGWILEGGYASSSGVNSSSGEAKVTGSDDLSWGLSCVTSSSKLPAGGLKNGLEPGVWYARTHTDWPLVKCILGRVSLLR